MRDSGVDDESEVVSTMVHSVVTVVSGSTVVVDNRVESVITSTNSDLIGVRHITQTGEYEGSGRLWVFLMEASLFLMVFS